MGNYPAPNKSALQPLSFGKPMPGSGRPPNNLGPVRGVLLTGLFSVMASFAYADISFEDRSSGERAGTEQRFALDVRNESIAKVIDTLSERYNFSVDGYPEHWSKDPMSFTATGDLERVLRSLLKDTSHVFEYHTDLATKETRIAGLKLLNEGVEGFAASNQPQRTTLTNNGGTITRGSGTRQPGRLADRIPADSQNLDIDLPTGSAGSTPAATPPVQVSGLSRSLEQRARQATGNTGPGSTANTPKATPAPIDPSVPNADMQALTQKALKDVKGLAEALRKAESGAN